MQPGATKPVAADPERAVFHGADNYVIVQVDPDGFSASRPPHDRRISAAHPKIVGKIVWWSPRSPGTSASLGHCRQIGRFRKIVGRLSVDSSSVDFRIWPVDSQSF